MTNPPIDPLREGLVMSLEMRLGGRGNLLQPGEGAYSQVLLKSPIILESQLEAIRVRPPGHAAACVRGGCWRLLAACVCS